MRRAGKSAWRLLFQRARESEHYADRGTEAGREQRFWLAMLYGAMAGYLTSLTVVYVYTRLTLDESNRGWINVVLVAALLFTIGFYLLRHRIVTMRHRLTYLVTADILAALFILSISGLDGGMGSPMACLLMLPVVYLAIGYPRPAVLTCGVVIIGGAAALTLVTRDSSSVLTAMFNMIALSLGLLLAVIGATARDWERNEIRSLRERLEVLATTDELTGCLNQRAFTNALEREIDRANQQGSPLALLVIDIDHFKQINDHHGHVDGDAVLHRLGALLMQMTDVHSIAGRPGGDELAVLAPGIDAGDASALAERIRLAFRAVAEPVQSTVSIGVGALLAGEQRASTLFRRADNALYLAKEQGRDRVAVAALPEGELACQA